MSRRSLKIFSSIKRISNLTTNEASNTHSSCIGTHIIPTRCSQVASTLAASKLSLRYHQNSSPAINQGTKTKVLVKSSRQRFREVPVSKTLLDHIERIGVGMPSSPKRRRGGNKKRVRFSHFHPNVQRADKPSHNSGSNNNETHVRKGVSDLRPPAPFGLNSEAKLVATIAKVGQQFPTTRDGARHVVPEIAFLGRSNVGKSSLLNALLHGSLLKYARSEKTSGRRKSSGFLLRKGVKAITSPKPGETRKIYLYELSERLDFKKSPKSESKKIRLVDLPGYGFAFSSPEDAAAFQQLMVDYILGRGKPLKRILLLLDARHGMKKTDIDFMRALQSIHSKTEEPLSLPPIQIVLTKCDLVNQQDLARRALLVKQQLSDSLLREPCLLKTMMVSVLPTGTGMRMNISVIELQRELAGLVH